MKAKFAFSIISVIVGLLTSLYIAASISAQQMSQNVMTRDIPSVHIDGGGKLTLDVSDDLGLTMREALNLVKALPGKKTDGTGVTIELLKPVDSTVHSKALVIRQIKPKLAGHLVDGGAEGIKVGELWEDQTVLPKDLNEPTIVHLRHTVLIELFNTTKSRIELRHWQIRFTYGAMPDATDATIRRVIDRMSNVDDNIWSRRYLDDPSRRILDRNVFMSRHIDVERLDDPTKTRDEQLAAISDGNLQTSWDLSTPSQQEWIEIFDITKTENNKSWRYLIQFQGEEQDRLKIPESIIPRPPTTDR